MLNKVRQLKKESNGSVAAGFTIIEVMIVLAIAGIIMAIVFLAIPALQKNNRNTQRKNDASRLAGLVNDYIANHNGQLPTDLVASIGSPTWTIMANPAAPAARPAAPPAPGADTMVLYTNATCDAVGVASVPGTSARQFAVVYYAEGTATSGCIGS